MEGRWNQGLPVRQPDHHGRASRDPSERHGGRRSLDQQSQFGNEGRPRRISSQNQRGPLGRISTGTAPLEDGIADLFHAVNDAIQEFGQFDQDFRQDVKRIRIYCNERIIEAVWMYKVSPRGSKSRNRQQRGKLREVDDFDGADHQPPGLQDIMEHLMRSLEEVLNAVDAFRPSQRRPSRYSSEDVSKIRQQLHRAYENLRRSSSIITQHHSEMETVTTELEMLRLFLSRKGAEEDGHEAGHEAGAARFHEGGGRRQVTQSGLQSQGAYGDDGDQAQEWDGGQTDQQGKPG